MQTGLYRFGGERFRASVSAAGRRRGLLNRLRASRWLILLATLIALSLPALAVAAQDHALAMGLDGPTILCRANGEMVVINADGTASPVPMTHDCCNHCLAAVSPVGFAPPAIMAAPLPSPVLVRVLTITNSSPVTAASALVVHARGPPHPDAQVWQHALL